MVNTTNLKKSLSGQNFGSFYTTVGGAEGDKCFYPTRLDTYGKGCYFNCAYCYARQLLDFRGLWKPNNPAVPSIDEIKKVKRGNVNSSPVYGKPPMVENSIYKGRFPIDVLKFKRDKHMHPTQKPVKLLQYLIQTYTKKGDTVLDFTMGSGSTGVASKSLKRNFIGIELDKEYYDIACKRIYGIKIKK